MDMPRTPSWIALLTVLGMTSGARAGDLLERLTARFAASPPAEAIPLGSDGCNHTFDRAGHPDTISKCARPSNGPQYDGYYVGGGCVWRGGTPMPGAQQGTWGWDYVGNCIFHPRVALGFCWNCRYQGGIGAYRTDGKHVPNVFGIHIPKEEGEEHEEHEEHHESHEGGREEGREH
jgi:hypothetical protein